MKLLLLSLAILCPVLANAQLLIDPYRFGPTSTLNNGITAYWKLDETSDGSGPVTRVDSGPNGQDLTDNNTVASAAGKINLAADLVSVNDESLSRADSPTMSTGDISFTFCAWVKYNIKNRYILAKTDNATGDEYGLDMTGDQWRFWIANGATYKVATTTGTWSTNTWYMIVGWHDASANTVNIQVNNGSVFSTDTAGTAPDSGGSTFRLGQYRTVVPFDGLIDEVAFWKRVLTDDERTELYKLGDGKTCCPF